MKARNRRRSRSSSQRPANAHILKRVRLGVCPLTPSRKIQPEQEIPHDILQCKPSPSTATCRSIGWSYRPPTRARHFDEDAMQELAASIRENGVLQPLLVRPRTERRFEIVFGERRYRGAAMAEKETVPVCIREMTDAQVLEAQLVENLQRQDVHPLHEAQGFAALLRLEEPKYSIELIAAKCGKSAGYVPLAFA